MLVLLALLALSSAIDVKRFPVDLADFPFVAVRRYRVGSGVEQCCSTPNATALQACLSSVAEKVSLTEAVSPEVSLGSDALGVVMMTSARLSLSYAVYSEAATARWAAAASRSRDLEFVVVEIDDGESNEYGAASTELTPLTLARLAGGRAPHWQKVPLVSYMLQRYATVLYVDADAAVVHTHTTGWLEDLLDESSEFDFVVSREGEGPKELIYSEKGAMRLNDATYLNTGVLLVRRTPWSLEMLQNWWGKTDEPEGQQYLLGRTYDQGALGHLFYTHGTPMRRRPPPPGAPPKTPAQLREEKREQQDNARKSSWRKRVQVVEPEVMNNHAPGGSFARPQPDADKAKWWCQHFAPPLLQLSGQGNGVRADVLRRVWLDGACPAGKTSGLAAVAQELNPESATAAEGEVGERSKVEISGDGSWDVTSEISRPECRHLQL